VGKTKTDLTWQELEVGATIVTPGNAAEYKSGDWRSMRPVVDNKKCIKCGTCYKWLRRKSNGKEDWA